MNRHKKVKSKTREKNYKLPKNKGKLGSKKYGKVRVGVYSAKVTEIIREIKGFNEFNKNDMVLNILYEQYLKFEPIEIIELIENIMSDQYCRMILYYRMDMVNVLPGSPVLSIGSNYYYYTILKELYNPEQIPYLLSSIEYYRYAEENKSHPKHNILDILLEKESDFLKEGLDSDLYSRYERLIIDLIRMEEVPPINIKILPYLYPKVSMITLNFMRDCHSENIKMAIMETLIRNIRDDIITLGPLLFVPDIVYERKMMNEAILTRHFNYKDLICLVDYVSIPLPARIELVRVMLHKINQNPGQMMIKLNEEDEPRTLMPTDDFGRLIFLQELICNSIFFESSIDIFFMIVEELNFDLKSLHHMKAYPITHNLHLDDNSQQEKTIFDLYKFLISENKKKSKKKPELKLGLANIDNLRINILSVLDILLPSLRAFKITLLDGDEFDVNFRLHNFENEDTFDFMYLAVSSNESEINLRNLSELSFDIYTPDQQNKNILLPLVYNFRDPNIHIHQRQLFKLAYLLSQQSEEERSSNYIMGIFSDDPGAGGGAAPVGYYDSSSSLSESSSFNLVREGPSRRLNQNTKHYGKPSQYEVLSVNNVNSLNNNHNNNHNNLQHTGGRKRNRKRTQKKLPYSRIVKKTLSQSKTSPRMIAFKNLDFKERMLSLKLLEVKTIMLAKKINIKDSVLMKLIKKQKHAVR